MAGADRKLLYGVGRDLDDRFHRYFHEADLLAISPDVMTFGIEHFQIDLDLKRDRGNASRYGRVCACPGLPFELAVAFEATSDQNASRNFMDTLAASKTIAEVNVLSGHRATFTPDRIPIRLFMRTCLNQAS